MRSRQITLLLLLGAFFIISLYLMRHPTLDDFPESAGAHYEKHAGQSAEQPDEKPIEQPKEVQTQSPPASTTEHAAPGHDTESKQPVGESTGATSDSHKNEGTGKSSSSQDVTSSAGKEHGKSDQPVVSDKTAAKGSEDNSPLRDINGAHPIDVLVGTAGKEFKETLSNQSKTLGEAVTEYKRRYKMHPPPNFDKWYEFAKRRNVKLIDEYDTIYDSLLPFWGLKPATIRERVKEAVGFSEQVGGGMGSNALMGVSVRDGKVTNVEGIVDHDHYDWQVKATKGMMASFVKFLPDMDLAFNIHDEPRVILPHDDLSRLVKKAVDEALPLAFKTSEPRNKFSKAKDIGDGKTFEEYPFTRFNVFAHQPTWTHSRQSCPPDSAARSLEEEASDRTDVWATTEGTFIQNRTAFTDICYSPSLKTTFGFFDRPNALKIVQDLVPIFSQSKISSFQDILYPSPWYWDGKVVYHKYQDFAWSEKKDSLYWRGSTTGGFSRNGGWRRHHRQKVVGYLNRKDNATILENTTTGDETRWNPKSVLKQEYSSLFDVHFVKTEQCDPHDCEAEEEYFVLAEKAAQNDAWKWKYLLDMDGNAFSGRWYAFLNSRSLPFKMSFFREWHEEWLKPWVHYVPVTLSGSEYFETLRYFDREEKGKVQALEIAEAGRQWSQGTLRNEDLEAWFFRLLLEYGRLVDDNRQLLGYRRTDTDVGEAAKATGA